MDVKEADVERSAKYLILELRAEVQHGFESLQTKIVQEIRDLRAQLPSSPMTSRPPVLSDADQHLQRCGLLENVSDNSPGESQTGLQEKLSNPMSTDTAMSIDGPGCNHLPVVKERSSRGLLASVNTNVDDWRDSIRRESTSQDVLRPSSFKNILERLPGNAERPLHRCAASRPFNFGCLAVILLNGVWLGYEAEQDSESARHWHKTVSLSFTIWFIFELVFKAIALQRYFLSGPDWKWNTFDVLLVLLSIPEFFASSLNVSLLRLVRLLKLSKALRVLRLFKFIRSLRVIITTVFYTLGTLFWCFVAMLLFNYASAILFKQALNMRLEDGVQFSEDTMHNFRSMWSTMMALYGMITGGQEWYAFALDFEEQGAHLALYILSIWIFFTIFGFVNVILAVFCAQGTEAIFVDVDLWLEMEEERRSAKVNELSNIFKMIDTESSGMISWDQFYNYSMGPLGKSHLQSQGIELFALADVWKLMDRYFTEGQNGEVDLPAFVMGFMRLSGEGMGTELMMLSSKVKALRSELRDFCDELRNKINTDLDPPFHKAESETLAASETLVGRDSSKPVPQLLAGNASSKAASETSVESYLRKPAPQSLVGGSLSKAASETLGPKFNL